MRQYYPSAVMFFILSQWCCIILGGSIMLFILSDLYLPIPVMISIHRQRYYTIFSLWVIPRCRIIHPEWWILHPRVCCISYLWWCLSSLHSVVISSVLGDFISSSNKDVFILHNNLVSSFQELWYHLSLIVFLISFHDDALSSSPVMLYHPKPGDAYHR